MSYWIGNFYVCMLKTDFILEKVKHKSIQIVAEMRKHPSGPVLRA